MSPIPSFSELIVVVFTVHVSIIKKITIPDNWQYEEARKLFAEPEVLDSKDIAVSIILYYNVRAYMQYHVYNCGMYKIQ